MLMYGQAFESRGQKLHLKPVRSAVPQTSLERVSRGGPLIWGVKLDTIPRPQPATTSAPSLLGSSRPRRDHHVLAQRTLDKAIKLCQHGYNFRIFIFAWKRRASLKRLTDSLLLTDYHGCTVHVDFHLDGGAHDRVVSFIDAFSWPHGRTRVNRHAERVGLERVREGRVSIMG